MILDWLIGITPAWLMDAAASDWFLLIWLFAIMAFFLVETINAYDEGYEEGRKNGAPKL